MFSFYHKDLCACLYVCVCVLSYIFFFCFLNIENKYAHLFPLVGGGTIPASPPILFSGLSITSDDNEFEIIHSPSSPIGSYQNNDNDVGDDEKASTIIENEDTLNNDLPRLYQNPTPTPFSTLKTAILNGISGEKINKQKPLTAFFFLH